MSLYLLSSSYIVHWQGRSSPGSTLCVHTSSTYCWFYAVSNAIDISNTAETLNLTSFYSIPGLHQVIGSQVTQPISHTFPSSLTLSPYSMIRHSDGIVVQNISVRDQLGPTRITNLPCFHSRTLTLNITGRRERKKKNGM